MAPPDSSSTADDTVAAAILDAQFAWVRARARRLAVAFELRDAAAQPPDGSRVGASAKTTLREFERRLPALTDAEGRAKQLVETQIADLRKSARVPGLVALERAHNFGEFEVTTLLLATMVACGETYAEYLDGAGPRGGYWGGAVSADLVWAFTEASLIQRLQTRRALLPTAPLLREGLVTLHVGPETTPLALCSASIEITPAAFARVLALVPETPASTRQP